MAYPSYPSDPALQSPAAMTGSFAPAQLPARRGIFAGFSNIERDGHWSLPRDFRARIKARWKLRDTDPD